MNPDDDDNLPATKPKPPPDPAHPWRWVRGGPSPNPAGRGHSPSKFSKKFLVSLSKSWELHGDKVLDQVRHKDPTHYLRICASLIPRQINVHTTETRPPAELSQTELEAIIVEDISKMEMFRAALEPLIGRVAELDPILADEMRMIVNG
jgi:hypothetical protein